MFVFVFVLLFSGALLYESPGGNQVDGLRKARFSGLQFIPHPLGEDGRGGWGETGAASRAVYPPCGIKGIPKGEKKVPTKT